MTPYKKCPKCAETLPRADYYHDKNGKIASYCRPCNKEYQRLVNTPDYIARKKKGIDDAKTCPACKTFKQPSEFYIVQGYKLFTYCKPCARVRERCKRKGIAP